MKKAAKILDILFKIFLFVLAVHLLSSKVLCIAVLIVAIFYKELFALLKFFGDKSVDPPFSEK
jgi:hypothetical protein